MKFLSWDSNQIKLSGFQALSSALKINNTLQVIPPSAEDMSSVIEDSRDKNIREKLSNTMTILYEKLATNRGDPSPGPFVMPDLTTIRIHGALGTLSAFMSREANGTPQFQAMMGAKSYLLFRRSYLNNKDSKLSFSLFFLNFEKP